MSSGFHQSYPYDVGPTCETLHANAEVMEWSMEHYGTEYLDLLFISLRLCGCAKSNELSPKTSTASALTAEEAYMNERWFAGSYKCGRPTRSQDPAERPSHTCSLILWCMSASYCMLLPAGGIQRAVCRHRMQHQVDASLSRYGTQHPYRRIMSGIDKCTAT